MASKILKRRQSISVSREHKNQFVAEEYLKSGKFFAKEELDVEDDSPSDANLEVEDAKALGALSVRDDHTSSVFPSPVSLSSVPSSERCLTSVEPDKHDEQSLLWKLICPLDRKQFKGANWPGRLYQIAKVFIFKVFTFQKSTLLGFVRLFTKFRLPAC